METRVCKTCGDDKELSFFPRKKKKDGTYWYRLECKACIKPAQQKRSKKHYENNKEEYLNRQRNYYYDNKEEINQKNKEYACKYVEEIKEYKKQYRKNNADFIAQGQKIYRKNNEEKLLELSKEYYRKNREKLIAKSSQNYQANKEKNRLHKNKYFRDRWANDPGYRLRKILSSHVNHYLSRNGSSKLNESCMNYFSYSQWELVRHLESQFEPWMTWKNHGKYDQKKWNDNDISTWKWQLDHIIPQSDLPFTSMSDDNFNKCWALSNLRPLSAKENYLDGMKRVRHNKGNK